MAISETMLKRIEEDIRNWDDKESDARKRFEKARRPWKKELDSMGKAIAASEEITQDDLAIQINTRD